MMMMEGSSVSEVRPMMQFVRKCCDGGNTIDVHRLHQMLKDVYQNFTLIHTTLIAQLEKCGKKFHQGSSELPYQYRWMTEDVGMVITFCRCQLNCMVNEDGLINNSSALFLENIERNLLTNVDVLSDYLSWEKLAPNLIEYLRNDHTDVLADEIEQVYQAVISRNEASLTPSNLFIGSEFLLEFLNQVHLDLQHEEDTASLERETMRGYLVLLRYYLENSTYGEEMNGFLISSQLVASKMAYYSYLSYYAYSRDDWNDKLLRISHHTQSDIRLGCLRAATIFPPHVSSSIPAMNSEVLIICVNCIQDNLSDLLKDGAFYDLTSSMINKFTTLQSGLSFLKFLFVGSTLNIAELEKLSDIRVRFYSLVINVGSLTLSCFNKEINGSITSPLSNFIKKVNLIEDESVKIMEGSVKEICGKMYRLHQGCGHHETSDDLQNKFKDVYRNFTSIHTAVIALLENCRRKFHQGSSYLPHQYRWMREDFGLVITFCRCQLNWMVNEDGLINNSSALLLGKIEHNLLINIEVLTDYLSREELDPDQIEYLRSGHIAALAEEVEAVYQVTIGRHAASLMPSNLLIGSEFILEFLNQVHQDLQHEEVTAPVERETMRGYLVLLRYYLEYSTSTDRINGEEMNDFLISSQLVASKMAYYSFFSYYAFRDSLKEKFAGIRHRIESDIRLGCLRAASVLPHHVSSSIPAMSTELLIVYVNCIQDNLSNILKDEALCDLTSSMINQFTTLQSGLSFLKFLLAGYGLNTADLEKLSDIRVHFQVLVRNVGSLTLSCLNKEMNGIIAPMLSNSIKNVNLILEESVEIMEGIVTEICGKMYLLHQGYVRGGTTDALHQKFKDVYRNFTSIHKALNALLGNCGRKFHHGSSDLPHQYCWMREDFGLVITFCRCQLNWMVNEDGLINNSSALLLGKIEHNLLINIEVLTDYLSREELDPDRIEYLRSGHIAALAEEVEAVYHVTIGRHEASLMPSNLLIGSELILDFLNQVHQDLQHKEVTAPVERETMRGYLGLLRYYLEYSTSTDRINGEEMNDFLISSQLVASKMAYYSFFSYYAFRESLKEKFTGIRHRIESDIRLGCLRAASVLPQHVSSSIPAMSTELLIVYVNCIQDNLSNLLKGEAFCDLTSSMINQFTILQSGLSFLKFLLAGYGLNTADLEKLSDIRVHFQALVRNVGSLTLSCLNKEMNGSIAPMLSDFIKNVNLLEEESIEIMEGCVTEICGKMYLLHQGYGRGETTDVLHQKFKDVYRNFTSIHTSLIALLGNCGRKFHQGSSDLPHQYRWMREDFGLVITFCRCQLNWMVNEDGLINNSSALLLGKIEHNLLINIEVLTDYLSREELDPDQIEYLRSGHIAALAEEVEAVYQVTIGRHAASLMPSNLLIGSEFILEFLNQVHQDLQHEEVTAPVERETMRGYLVLLRYYLEYSTSTDRINGEEMNDFLVSSQLVASKMAYYSFFSYYAFRDSLKEKFASIKHRIESDIRLGCLRAALVLPQRVFSSISAMSTELLIVYVNCIQDNLSEFREDKAFIDLTSQITDQFTTLPTHLEKLSSIRVWFRALVRNVGLLAVSCLNDEMKGSLTSELSDLIKKVKITKEEIIDDMYCIVLGGSPQEYLIIHRLHYLIILFENLEDLIDSKSDLIMTWKDQSDAVHMNLVLFRSFIQNIQGNSKTHDGSEIIEEVGYSEEEITTQAEKIQLLRKYLRLDNDQINGEKMSKLLISVQLSTFKMVCHYLFRRHREVCWWKVYVPTRDRIDSHMRVGILRAVVLSLEGSTTLPLSDELLMGYLDCIQDNMMELEKDEASDQMKGLLERVQEISFLVLFLFKHGADQEKLSDVKLRFQALLRNIGSFICSYFNNRPSNWVTEQSIGVADLLEELNFLQDETHGFQYTVILHRIRQESPKVHLPFFFDLLLHNWKDFMDSESHTVKNNKDQCQSIHEILVLFRSFIQNFTTSPTGDEEERKLYNLISEAGYVAEYLLDSFALEACPVSCTSCWISEFTVHIKRIKGIMVDNRKIPAMTDVMVGFEVEMKLIKDIFYSRKQLDVVSIVGMPGSGKTTLAKKVYEDPSTREHFDVRAWFVVSQEYKKKELFLTVLGSKLEVTDVIRRKSETELSVMVHQVLMGRRYLIVLDDVWEIEAFMGVKNYFPNDNIGSRIMLTSRSTVIGLQAKYHSDPIKPNSLTDDESWDLLEQKVYPQGKCPLELCQLGKQIARKCRGLPLAIVVVAGFLAKSVQNHDLWEQVAGNLNSSYLAHDSQTQWMGPLELSYKVLPDHLKPLFLYFGAFPEDEEIPTDRLMWLWIAEGFLQETGSGSLETQAEKSLKDLIDRNLVMVAKRSSDGRVKACHVHDLLRDMCLAKAKQEKFMEQIFVDQELPDPVLYQRRLSVFLKRSSPSSSRPLIPYKYFPVVSVSPPLRTLLFFNKEGAQIQGEYPNPAFSGLKLSRVIHSEHTTTNVDDILKLLHLRYVSIRTDCNNITESLSNLKNLEILIIKGITQIVLPSTMWEMVKLRHLHVNDRASFQDAPENSSKLENLVTLSTPVIDSGEVKKFIKRVPNVQKLRCILNNEHSYSNSDINHCHDLEALDKLETLKASYCGRVRFSGQFKLPLSLRKLSLSNFRLEWSQVSIFQKLPNLEVLKLRSAAVEDEFWDTGDDEFPNLKFLKLENLNIKKWDASEENFPSLEKLVLEKCKQLEEIPSSFGEFNCLEKMEVIWCSLSAVKSAKEIEKELEKVGNCSLKVHIYPPELESRSSS